MQSDHHRVLAALASLGGIAPARDLTAAGITTAQLRQAVFDHAVLRFRKGWYALFDLPDEVVHASRVGGTLACMSAARHHGLWVPEDPRLHVSVPVHGSRLRSSRDHHVRLSTRPAGTVVHWCAGLSAPYAHAEAVPTAIRRIASCAGADAAFVVLESALRLERMRPQDVPDLVAPLPREVQELLLRAGSRSDSGTESMLALLLMRARIPFRQQVRIAGVGPVDFLIGERLIVEVDSIAHHSNPTRDRARDAAASERGYRTLRFMYAQLVHDPDAVRRAILAAIARRDHRAA